MFGLVLSLSVLALSLASCGDLVDGAVAVRGFGGACSVGGVGAVCDACSGFC